MDTDQEAEKLASEDCASMEPEGSEEDLEEIGPLPSAMKLCNCCDTKQEAPKIVVENEEGELVAQPSDSHVLKKTSSGTTEKQIQEIKNEMAQRQENFVKLMADYNDIVQNIKEFEEILADDNDQNNN